MNTAINLQRTAGNVATLTFKKSTNQSKIDIHESTTDEYIWQNFLATHHIIHLLRPDFFLIYKVSRSTTLFQHNVHLDLGDGTVTYDKIMRYMLSEDLQNIKAIDKAMMLMTNEQRLQPYDYIFKVCSTINCPNKDLKRIMRTSFIIHSQISGVPELVFFCFHDVSSMVSSIKPNNYNISLDPMQAHLEEELNAKLKVMRPEKAAITAREKDILICLHNGMNSKKIASSLFISKATVDTHRQNMLRKFDLPNTAALLKKGVEEGWI